MANPEHLEILKKGVEAWNTWRELNPEIGIDLVGANLIRAHLKSANLSNADLTRANLINAGLASTNLNGAVLQSAKLTGATLLRAGLSDSDLDDANCDLALFGGANLSGASLKAASLRGASLTDANLSRANLTDADLNSASLTGAILTSAILRGADLNDALIGWTIFSDVDLSEVMGLLWTRFDGPSTIGIDTLYRSRGKIPIEFLRGCGVPEDFGGGAAKRREARVVGDGSAATPTTFFSSVFGVQTAIPFYSCFISYSSRDEEFARRLHSRMRDEKLRVWFAPEDIKGGEKLEEQLERAIQLHDRLLIVLSEHSMQSEWVMTELRKARKQEIQQRRRKLFPIRLASIEGIRDWECFDADSGKDLAVELREYFIPDFSNWKDHDSFEVAFDRLLKDLRAVEAS